MTTDLAFNAQWVGAIPPLSLFRDNTTVVVMRNNKDYIDRLECEEKMRSDTSSSNVSWSCAQLSDALRRQSRVGMDARYCAVGTDDFSSVVNYITLPNLHSDVQGLSYFSELSSLKDTMQYLLSKTLNQRCQSRKIGEVSLRCFESSIAISLQLKKIVLCSLLGNYETTKASTRPRPEVRTMLYDIMLDRHTLFNGWFKHLLIDGSIIVLYCLREYLLFAIRDNPGLCDSLVELMQLSKFASITESAMSIIRVYFDAHLFEPSSRMSQTVYEGNDRSNTPFDWCVDLKHQLVVYQKSVLCISYRRPKRHLFQCFDTVRKKLEMVVNPWLKAQSVDHVQDDDDMLSHAAVAYSGVSMNDDDIVATQPPELSLGLYIIGPQLTALNDIILRIIPMCRTDALKEFIPWLRYFGISPDVITYTLTLNTPTVDDVLSDEKLRDRLYHLRKNQPHAYNLIQIATRVISDQQMLTVLCNLPLHYWRNQITAIQSRFGSNATKGGLLHSMLYFVYCDVCGTVYSLLREFNSVYKQSYTYGYRDAVVDYDTDDIYCKNKKTTHIGTCAARPLTHVLLLGRVIQYQNKTILLCPQIGCGMPMVLNTSYCIFNDRGVACCDCTRAMYASQHTEREKELMTRFVAELDQAVVCALCDKSMWLPSQMYWYPQNVVICRSHTNAWTLKRFIELAPRDTSTMTEWDVRGLLKQVAVASSENHSVAPQARPMKSQRLK